jgi:phosphonate transport system ATP-binding protein
VQDVTLGLSAGAFVGVIGRSGAGKSTMLRMINRLTEPGRVLRKGVDITRLRGQALRDWRSDWAMIFQHFNLVGRLDVLTSVLMGHLNKMASGRAWLGGWGRDQKAIALSALEQFDIANLAAQRAQSLSGGQQQRVAIARALVPEPHLLRSWLSRWRVGAFHSHHGCTRQAVLRRGREHRHEAR